MQEHKISQHKIDPQLSSIGIGTYLGEEDDKTDACYFHAIIAAIGLGCSVIDTAINYRDMRSEKIVGRVIQSLMKKDPQIRKQVIIATKGGFIPVDSESGEASSEFVRNRFLKTGILNRTDIVMGCHSLKPEYIHECVLMSLKNLGLEYIDIYYIHNPELQLSEISQDEFYHRLSLAFDVLERFVKEGRIRMYGTATWDGYRLDIDNPGRISLKRVLDAAEATSAGSHHHFQIIQLPINIYMPEAAVKQNQEFYGKWVTTLDAAEKIGLLVMSSATLLQTQALKENKIFSFQSLDNLGDSAARRAIQIIRSLRSVTTSLVGMKTVKHVQDNLQLLKIPKLDPEEARRILAEFL
ncbi:MAG: aldo/keto reductase [Candidatus Jettenia sp. CY-1]|nr:MAG: aldo/keto reductase [Candidatus Jettenia sp. CY-1]